MLRVVREAAGLSLRALAARSGTSHSYIAEVERGERVPTARWLRDVQEALADHLAEKSA